MSANMKQRLTGYEYHFSLGSAISVLWNSSAFYWTSKQYLCIQNEAYIIALICKTIQMCMIGGIHYVSWYKYPQVHYNKFFTVVSTGAVDNPIKSPLLCSNHCSTWGSSSKRAPSLTLRSAADKDRLNASHYWLLLSSGGAGRLHLPF